MRNPGTGKDKGGKNEEDMTKLKHRRNHDGKLVLCNREMKGGKGSLKIFMRKQPVKIKTL